MQLLHKFLAPLLTLENRDSHHTGVASTETASVATPLSVHPCDSTRAESSKRNLVHKRSTLLRSWIEVLDLAPQLS